MKAGEDPNDRYLAWVRGKHGYQDPKFVDALVHGCADAFNTNRPLTEDERAEIYNRVRQSIEATYDACLRKHARISCCS